MKKGFALLETIVVITFVSVSLLLLYGPFSNMINNSKKNILYDDVSNIYKTYYVKEYLNLDKFKTNINDIKEIDCNLFNLDGCNTLKKEFNINKMYIALYDLKTYDNSLYSSNFNNYIKGLSNKGNYKYRFIIEFNNNDTYSYSSLGLSGGKND